MLSDETIEKLTERLVDRIEEGNLYTINRIAKDINKIGSLSYSDARKLEQTLKYGGSYSKIVKKLSEITKLNVKDIYKIFEEVAKNDYQFAEKFYNYRNVDYIPYEQNLVLKRQVEALARITARKYVNYSNTLVFTEIKDGKRVYTPLFKTYSKAIDEAVINVAQGKETFQNEMFKAIKKLNESGIKTIDRENDRAIRLDSMVRMHLNDSIKQLHNEVQKQIAKDIDADGIEITVHEYPAPDHADSQGRQFSNKEFEKLQKTGKAIDYTGVERNLHHIKKNEEESETFRKISQYNCQHYTYAIVLGINKPQYSNEQLDNINNRNEKGFDFEDKHYSMYEGTQLQRNIESELRKQKNIYISSKNSNDEDGMNKSLSKISILTKKYNKLCNESGLIFRKDRLRVSGYTGKIKKK